MAARFAPLEPGDPVAVASYPLRARLGSGGMGNVYLSFTPGGRAIAIKVVRPELASDPEFRRRFLQEVTIAQRVQGIYTASVIDADPDAAQPWLATAYIPGPPLNYAVAQHGPLPLPTVFRLLSGVAEGLAAIHAVGLVHRDLKPSNVLLAADGPRVIDFGIAHAADASALTSTGVLIGTPAFMAPEQVLGDPVTTATDVFALGHLAVYAATGRTVFGEGHQSALAYRIVNREPDLSGCPRPVSEIAARCLAKNPAGRPQVAEIIDNARAQNSGQTMRLADAMWLPPAVSGDLASYDAKTVQAAPPAGVMQPGHHATVPRTRPKAGASPETIPASGRDASPAPAPARSRQSPLLLIGAIALGALLVISIPKLLGRSGTPAGTTSTGAAHGSGQAVAATGGSPATSSAATSLPGGYLLEYRDVTFTLPGGSCTYGGNSIVSYAPSDVLFTAQGPQVATGSSVGGGDLTLDCADPYGNNNTDIRPNNTEIAAVTGSPDAQACHTAVLRSPLSSNILWTQLTAGTQFCLIGGSSQLVRITLLSKSTSTYDLTWSATAWSIPPAS